jgi:LL-diaminopimelate aminotransferase
MVILQQGFLEIKREYIFPIIEKKVIDCQKKDLLNLGIGDVALPLVKPAAEAFCEAIETMKIKPIGYPSSHGEKALREAIVERYYKNFEFTPADVFISDGINSDLGNLAELFSSESLFGVSDPTYPVPLDVCYMAGRWPYLSVIPTDEKDFFLPSPPPFRLDVMYLCSPNNPSGTAMKKDLLQKWVNWALEHKAILIMDAAYSDFVQDPDVPKTIYEIEGAKQCAIELRSFSKSAGFTGLRCSYSIVPSTLHTPHIKTFWAKRMATKSNGVSYPVQQAALACLKEEGFLATMSQVKHYLAMASKLYEAMKNQGFEVMGGTNAPYVFVKCPEGYDSWSFFDFLLNKASIVSVPGSGFGNNGKGYIRLSGFITLEVCETAIKRLKNLFTLI